MANKGVVWVDRSLFRKAPVMGPALEQILQRVTDYEANEAQNRMRTEAPWRDVTGNARQGLFARSFHAETGPGRNALGQFTRAGQKYVVVLYHTMPYGIYLETRNEGRYAIVEPNIEPTGRAIMDTLRGVFRQMERVA